MTQKRYGTFEGMPAVYDDHEAWVLFENNGGWYNIPLAEVLQNGSVLSEDDYRKKFPNLPALPATAFQAVE